jgi:hypothetical protein
MTKLRRSGDIREFHGIRPGYIFQKLFPPALNSLGVLPEKFGTAFTCFSCLHFAKKCWNRKTFGAGLERLKKFRGRAERGFLGFGEASAKAQVCITL